MKKISSMYLKGIKRALKVLIFVKLQHQKLVEYTLYTTLCI